MYSKSQMRAKHEGIRAWREGVALRDCPYTDANLRQAWRDGWIERDKRGEVSED